MHRSDLFPRGEKAEPARARNEPKMCKQPDAWSETWHDVRDDLFSPRTATGGIAQLVERQLCKLDVRGSSPRASTSFGKRVERGKELLTINHYLLTINCYLFPINCKRPKPGL